MIRLLRALFAAPEAEADAAAWATRFAAHLGLGAILWLVLAGAIGPGWASGLLAGGYSAWEALQWPGGRRMAWDGALDCVAVWLALTGLWAVAHGQGMAATGCGLAALAVIAAGVERRR